MKRFLSLISLFLALTLSAHEGRIKVACVGNSVTYGYKLQDRVHDAYPAQLQRMLGEGYEVRNFGHSGATLLQRGHNPYNRLGECAEALSFAADIVVIHLGLNDTDPRDWPNFRDDFESDYQTLIRHFREANPKAKIWICQMTPICDRHARFLSGTRDWFWQIQEAIAHVAEHCHTGLIDLHTPLYSRPQLFPDALHPDPQGAGILARTVYQAVTGDYGGLALPPYMSSHMVMQRDTPLVIEGTANAGEEVSVTLENEKGKGVERLRAHAGADGKWNVTLSAHKAGGPYALRIKAESGERSYEDILFGEVWLCSGQSNMQFKVKQSRTAKEDLADASHRPLLRLFSMKGRYATDARAWSEEQLRKANDMDYFDIPSWQKCSEEEAADFSAVAYAFGCMLQDSLQVPVGLVCNAVGGSTAESWISRKTLEFEYPAILKDWRNNDHIQEWARTRGKQNTSLSKNPLQRHPFDPCYLYETGIAPLRGMTIKGMIWYQGESNAHNMELHERLFPLLVKDMRAAFRCGNAPFWFYFVQLSSLSRPTWSWFRDSQRRLAGSLQRCEMVVSSDLGDSLDVHPKEKREVGHRLARQALFHNYSNSHLMPCGPCPLHAQAKGGRVIVAFAWAEGLRPSEGGETRGFEIEGDNGLFYPAKVSSIRKDKTQNCWEVVLESDCGKHPRSVRYGWQPFTRANLVNKEGLPASTFRLEIGKD